PVRTHLMIVAGIMLFAALVQMGLGTQVREAVDLVVKANPDMDRSLWLDQVGMIDHLHRSTSWTLLILGGYLTWFILKVNPAKAVRTTALAIALCIVLQILLGIGLAYMGMPASFQVFHLTVAAVIVSGLILLLYLLNEAKYRFVTP